MAVKHRIPVNLSQQEIERFWSCVDKSPGQGPKGECWHWKDKTTNRGYGQFQLFGIRVMATRVSFVLHHGYDPYPFFVCHSCDNPPCVRGSHIFKGTPKQNSEDMVKKGRSATGKRSSVHQHPESYSGENHWTHRFPEKRKRGEAHNRAKLTEKDVKAIRKCHPHTMQGYEDLALKYGVKPGTIVDILRYRSWTHI